MVDRITPMTSTAHRLQLADKHGVDDAWPVVCEPFVQWVLEENSSTVAGLGTGRRAVHRRRHAL
jgi:mannitol-1-phosphate/altronate dehydrogenase